MHIVTARQAVPRNQLEDEDMPTQLRITKDRKLTKADVNVLLSEYAKLQGESVAFLGKAKRRYSIFSTPADLAAASVDVNAQYRKLSAAVHMFNFAVRIVDSGLVSTITELGNALENEANYGSGHMDSNAKEVAAQHATPTPPPRRGMKWLGVSPLCYG